MGVKKKKGLKLFQIVNLFLPSYWAYQADDKFMILVFFAENSLWYFIQNLHEISNLFSAKYKKKLGDNLHEVSYFLPKKRKKYMKYLSSEILPSMQSIKIMLIFLSFQLSSQWCATMSCVTSTVRDSSMAIVHPGASTGNTGRKA